MNRNELFDHIRRKKSFLCIGLDTDISKIPAHLLKEEDSVFALREAPENLRVFGAGKDHLLEDTDEIALRWVKPLKDVKKNPNFKNTHNLSGIQLLMDTGVLAIIESSCIVISSTIFWFLR